MSETKTETTLVELQATGSCLWAGLNRGRAYDPGSGCDEGDLPAGYRDNEGWLRILPGLG